MGSDNLHHKRKARQAKDLARRKAKRAPYDRVLIVCEGSKTEPNYLQELIDYFELNSANVEIDGSSGSSPISVIRYAKRRYDEEKKKNDSFDRVFCVFDKDTHASYEQAVAEIVNFRPSGIYQAIPSVPCFEYWLLLHFEYSTKPYSSYGGKSACDCIIKDLKKYISEYAKGTKGLFNDLIHQTDQARAFSEKASREATGTGTDNPTTLMHKLVDYLIHLKD